MSETFYSPAHISGAMSLRKPQIESLNVLDKILSCVSPNSGVDSTSLDSTSLHEKLQENLESVKSLYPTCTDFERDFMSITFALATGVGKTRLMGAFIAYLYTNHNVKNFFVVILVT